MNLFNTRFLTWLWTIGIEILKFNRFFSKKKTIRICWHIHTVSDMLQCINGLSVIYCTLHNTNTVWTQAMILPTKNQLVAFLSHFETFLSLFCYFFACRRLPFPKNYKEVPHGYLWIQAISTGHFFICESHIWSVNKPAKSAKEVSHSSTLLHLECKLSAN